MADSSAPSASRDANPSIPLSMKVGGDRGPRYARVEVGETTLCPEGICGAGDSSSRAISSSLIMIVGAIVSIVAGWPAQFGGKGDPVEVTSEFFSRGTALAPPFVPLILFAIFMAVARRTDRWGTAAIVGTVLLSIVFIVGSLGEAFAESTPHVPRVVLISSGIIGSFVSALVLVTGAATLREKGHTKSIVVPKSANSRSEVLRDPFK